MAVETVRVFVEDLQTPTAQPIEDVLVRVFDSNGDFVTQDLTVLSGGEAVADFSLDGDDPPIEYTIRLSKTGVAFDGAGGDSNKSPLGIQVYSPPANSPTGTNDFDVSGETFVRPTAPDPNMCRCSGFFRRGDGRPYANMAISIEAIFNPTVVAGDAVMGTQLHGRTDVNGYFQIDLYRGGQYVLVAETVGGMNPFTLYVPDASSANIIDLVFPVVSSVVFSPSSVSIAVGESISVIPTVSSSDGRTLEGAAHEDVTYTSADEAVASVCAMESEIVITGVAAGATTVVPTKKDDSVVVLPDGGIAHTPLSVTVTA